MRGEPKGVWIGEKQKERNKVAAKGVGYLKNKRNEGGGKGGYLKL
jgi:hypothetical protein